MKKVINIDKKAMVPLIGCIAFGIIDRGSSLIQIRPTTICNLSCSFCSTDAGVQSNYHEIDYVVELNYLLSWIKSVIAIKNCRVEINIDSVGEPTTYIGLIPLVENLRKFPDVYKISMQTNGTLLNKKKIAQLEDAGLDRINLSIHALDNELAKNLAGCNIYDINKIINIARVLTETKINLALAPVWIPGINDKEIPKLILLAKELNCDTCIQKYETYRYSRKIKGAKEINYWKFYKQLKAWEKEFNKKLVFRSSDLNIVKAPRVPEVFKKGDKVLVEMKLPGWIKGEMIGAAKNRCITVINAPDKIKIGNKIRVRIIETKNNIYLAEIL